MHTIQKVILLLAAVCVFLAQGTATYAQTAKRSFQVSLWPDTSASVVPTPSDADVKTFWELYGQPAAPADPATQASYLQGYFDYANSMNSNCDLSLGIRGHTFNFDGCRVWIVMGWLAGNF